MESTSKYKYTTIALFIGLIYYIVVLVANTDFIETIIAYLSQFDKYELNELIIAVFIVAIGITADITHNKCIKRYYLQLNRQRLHMLRTTTRTMQDIINNLVIALQYFRVASEGTDLLDEESLDMIDDLIEDTTSSMNKLSNMDSTPEKEIYAGLSIIDTEEKQNSTKDFWGNPAEK